jgi:katanin p60 ATPase-containing subunit A1
MQALLQSNEKAVVETVLRDVVQQDLGIDFADIAALDTAKRLLSEAVILPLMVPEFFTGIREPWKGVLLFGPPGTGKTLLAKAVCSLNQSTFFNCPSSTLVSKYRGESEKIVRCLFEAARHIAPSVVFLDEVDALVGSRGESGEHEASRRLKTEIFSQMDGISSGDSGKHDGLLSANGVMVLATTNCPWDLDEAMRRRLEKRIFIPMPDHAARRELLRIYLKSITLSDNVNMERLCDLTEGYSGADVHIVCREAAMMPMRKLLQVVDSSQIQALRKSGQLKVQAVDMADFEQAISNTKPSVGPDTIGKYATWMSTYGSS